MIVSLGTIGDHSTTVGLVQLGWEDGEAWGEGYVYFDRAGDYVLQRLKNHLENDQ